MPEAKIFPHYKESTLFGFSCENPESIPIEQEGLYMNRRDTMGSYVVRELAMWQFKDDKDEIEYRVRLISKALQVSYTMDNFEANYNTFEDGQGSED